MKVVMMIVRVMMGVQQKISVKMIVTIRVMARMAVELTMMVMITVRNSDIEKYGCEVGKGVGYVFQCGLELFLAVFSDSAYLAWPCLEDLGSLASLFPWRSNSLTFLLS